MNKQRHAAKGLATLTLALLATQPMAALAQVPVDEDGKVIGSYEPALANEDLTTGSGDVPLMSAVDLEELVGPVALYPDDLLAIILPAAAYPQQILDAQRFLERLEDDSSLEPDPAWDESIVALLNYPEVIELMSDDIDWAWRLGEAVIAQQQDVLSAIESFRDRAYNAGNLKSDNYQTVARNNGHIEITPVQDDVIYVPYYEPERVVVYQPRPVYYYYPRSYPVYYYPYTSAYDFHRGYFWGVTTAFSIGWYTNSLHVWHHSYHGHPYYGHHYRDRWWYRRPTMHHHTNTYIDNSTVTVNRYYNGDRWRPRNDRRDFMHHNAREANNRYTANRQASREASARRRSAEQRSRAETIRRRDPVSFRQRPEDFEARTEGQRSRAQVQRSERREFTEQRSNTRGQRDANDNRRNQEYVTRNRDRNAEGVLQNDRRNDRRNDREYMTGQREQRQQAPQRREQASQQRRATTPRVNQQRREQQTTRPPQQRQQRSAPPPQQRQQRSAPPPQQRSAPSRQQRSAPPPQQRSAPPPQQRSAPSRQQRSASPPQRKAQSQTRSTQNKSESRRSNNRR